MSNNSTNQIAPPRTGCYRFTVANDIEGNQKIKELRAENKVRNAAERLAKLKDPTYRPRLTKVSVFGRLGKENPNNVFYKNPYRQGRGWNTYQYIKKAHAARFDVYIHTLSH